MALQKIGSPLRYPGGKSKAIAQILPYLPPSFSEYREPFIGGGSLFIYLKQQYPDCQFWMNDLNYDLFCFWHCAQTQLEALVAAVRKIKATAIDGRLLFKQLVEMGSAELSEFERAVRFFVLNRISFSGTVDCGGFSEQAFRQRFTDSSIDRLLQLKTILAGAKITCLDYQFALEQPGENVFIFLDPPYLKATDSRLYGKKGDLHLGFNHQQFAEQLKHCPHQWLITYDDSPEIRENFAFAYLYSWELQYGMNNYMQAKAAKGKELLITNYPISPSH